MRRRASGRVQAVLFRLSAMSGVLHPVGSESVRTYWARRGLVFAATTIFVLALALIIGGPGSGSAATPHPDLSRFCISGCGVTQRGGNDHPDAIVHGHLGPSYTEALNKKESQAEGIDKEATAGRSGVLHSQGTPADAHCQAAHSPEAPHHLSVVVDQRLG
jgi:hypothetical protein